MTVKSDKDTFKCDVVNVMLTLPLATLYDFKFYSRRFVVLHIIIQPHDS